MKNYSFNLHIGCNIYGRYDRQCSGEIISLRYKWKLCKSQNTKQMTDYRCDTQWCQHFLWTPCCWYWFQNNPVECNDDRMKTGKIITEKFLVVCPSSRTSISIVQISKLQNLELSTISILIEDKPTPPPPTPSRFYFKWFNF